MRLALLLLFATSSLVCSCQSKTKSNSTYSSLFAFGKATGQLNNSEINEASGLDASIANTNKFWTHNDSGGKPELFLIDAKAQYVASVTLAGIRNRDWEDIAVGPGPDSTKNYVYVGEIGDNNAEFAYKYIYRFVEPVLQQGVNTSISTFDTIQFQVEDGQRDTEAIFIDEQTKDLYIFSKREAQIKLYLLAYPQRTDTINIAKQVAILPITQVVAADYDAASGELILKNYDSIYYWKKLPAETIAQAIAKKTVLPPYKREPQGEAICFSLTGDGYYTLSEQVGKQKPELIFYKRN
jgi:hypothetical protein